MQIPQFTRTRLMQKQAAAYLGLAEITLKMWRRWDKGPPYYRIGRNIFYAQEDLDDWLAMSRVDHANRRAVRRAGHVWQVGSD